MNRKKGKGDIPVVIHTLDSDMKFAIQDRSSGAQLFDMVCKALGLREPWYFGLQFKDTRGNVVWLKMDRKVMQQRVSYLERVPLIFDFLVRFYPEDLSEELIQEVTQNLFYLQVKKAILDQSVYCAPEASVLLASYSVQTLHGDYDEQTYVAGTMSVEELLPRLVLDQYQMTAEMWEERIKIWYSDHKGLTKDEAQMEYLKIAQDLEMYGVNYFQIKNKRNTDMWMGINALGLSVYNVDNKLTPVLSFGWSEIKDVEYRDKKFKIKTFDKKDPETLSFYSENLQNNKQILELCQGNHELFMQRRRPDSLEIQHMKQQTKAARLARQNDRQRYQWERELRHQSEREKEELEIRFLQLQEELNATREALIRCQEMFQVSREALLRAQETNELLEQKGQLIETERDLLVKHLKSTEQHVNELSMAAARTVEEKMVMEQKFKDADFLAKQVILDNEQHQTDMVRLKEELVIARDAEMVAKGRLHTITNHQLAFYQAFGSPSGGVTVPGAAAAAGVGNMAAMASGGLLDSTHLMLNGSVADLGGGGTLEAMALVDGDMNQMSLEMEKERMEYQEKSKYIQDRLKILRSEIETLKVEEKRTHLDRLHEENLQRGENKYSTLQKTKSGSTKSRVAYFEEL